MTKFRFAALRFTEDENLKDKIYWYLAPHTEEGEFAFAPVGMHDRIQRGTAERVLETDAASAPYDVRLVKRVLYPAGTGEFGGRRYDGKHYTRFGRLRILQRPEEGATFLSPAANDERVYRALLQGGCVTLAGGEEVASLLFALCQRKEEPVERLLEIGLTRAEISALRVLLTQA